MKTAEEVNSAFSIKRFAISLDIDCAKTGSVFYNYLFHCLVVSNSYSFLKGRRFLSLFQNQCILSKTQTFSWTNTFSLEFMNLLAK